MLVKRQSFKQRFGWKAECECDIFGKRQVKGQGKSKGKAKGKWKSKDRKGFQCGRPADSLEFEEEFSEETNETGWHIPVLLRGVPFHVWLWWQHFESPDMLSDMLPLPDSLEAASLAGEFTFDVN